MADNSQVKLWYSAEHRIASTFCCASRSQTVSLVRETDNFQLLGEVTWSWAEVSGVYLWLA